MALTRWPSEPNAWLLPWTIWQLRGKSGSATTDRSVQDPGLRLGVSEVDDLAAQEPPAAAPGHHQDHPQVGVPRARAGDDRGAAGAAAATSSSGQPGPAGLLASSLPDHVHVLGLAGRFRLARLGRGHPALRGCGHQDDRAAGRAVQRRPRRALPEPRPEGRGLGIALLGGCELPRRSQEPRATSCRSRRRTSTTAVSRTSPRESGGGSRWRW